VSEEREQVAGRYRIEGELARGGMAVVYRAHDEVEGRDVVLKRLRPELRDRSDVAQLFQREYHTLAQIRHPRIIEVYEYGVDQGGPYYTMELLDGQDLRELAPVPWADACVYLRDVAYSLALLHTRRLLHRDLSPRNVRRTGDGRAKLFDFGTMATFGVPRDVVGTAPYVPPEALRSAALDHRADLYAFGALAYYVLTRKHAFPARSIEDLPNAWQQPVVPPTELVPDIPKPLESLVLALLSLDPAARPAHAAQVIEHLDAITGAIAGRHSDELVEAAQSYLLSSQLAGRDHEMKRLDHYLDRAVAGHGRALIIEGNPGVGRSRMLAEISMRGQLRGATVVAVTADRSAAAHGVSRSILRSLLRTAPTETIRAAAPYLPVLVYTVPELTDLSGRSVEPAALPDDYGERRVREQRALLSCLTDLAASRPLVILIDDYHRADEASASLLASLAQDCQQRKVLIVAALKLGSPVAAPEPVRILRALSKPMRLHRLSRTDTAAFVQSMFGAVPNMDRVAAWMHDISTGTPAQIMELARHLVDTGGAQYAGGIWVLPAHFTQRAVPASLSQALAVRLGQLGPTARELSQRMSVADGALADDLVAAIGSDLGEVPDMLEELTRKGVIEHSEHGYSFVHDAMQELVLAQLDVQTVRAHDLRLGEAMLARAAPGDRLSAGAHLMRGGDEVRGARLFADAFREERREPRSLDLPALERAVAIHERHDLSPNAALRMRGSLVRAGYTLDRDLAYRYGESTLRAMHRASGLHITDALHRVIGNRAALIVGFSAAYLRWRFTPRSRRTLHPASAIRQLVQVLTSLLGAMSLGIDVSGMRRLVPTARSLLAFPKDHAVRAGYLLCETLFLFMFGREDEHRAMRQETFSRLEDSSAFPELRGIDRTMMLEGALLAAGICEAFYADSAGEQLARRLEQVGSHIGKVSAHRVELVRHLMRGEREAAEPRRRAVELLSLEVGASTWQLELWLAAMESLVALFTDDHLQAKQLLEVYRGFVAQAPSLRVYEEMLRARVERRLGELSSARARIATVCAQLAPREHVGWDAARYTHVDVLLAAGDAEGALRLARETLACYSQNDDLHVVRLMMCRLEALARARLGELEPARASIAVLVRRVTPTGHPLLLARLHEAAFELAREANDRAAALSHLEAMEQAIEPTGNPALLALLHSAAQSAREQGFGGKAPGSAPPPNSRDSSDVVTAVSSAPLRRKRPTPSPHS
jgi:tRNA A-37 threonylcarbamoyl transferase component Bud32